MHVAIASVKMSRILPDMDQRAFVRKIGGALPQYAWFLGAGTSQSAGLPTAYDVIWDLKTRYYCSEENQKLSIQDVQNAAVREKIDGFVEARGLPKSGTPAEYSEWFRLSFGDDLEAQRKYIREQLSETKVALALGHRALAALMQSGMARTVFTTNFDNVLEKASASVAGKDLSAFHLEGSAAALAALNSEDFPIYVKMHGDFRYESIKNLPDALKEQDVQLGRCLKAAALRFGFIVVGYSGRDESVMRLFEEACEADNAFPHGLFWLILKGSAVPPPVARLMELAKAKGITADLVEIETFDSVLSRIWRHLPSPDPALDGKVRRAAHREVNIPVPAAGSNKPILRTNALPIVALPKTSLAITFKKPKEWLELKEALNEAGETLAITKAEAVIGWGLQADVKEAFGSDLAEIGETEVSEKMKALDANLYLKASVEKALCLALRRDKPLLYRNSRGRSYLIADAKAEDQTPLVELSGLVGKVAGVNAGLFTTPTERHPERQQIAWAECVEVSIEQRGDFSWLLVQPNVWIWPKHGRRDAQDFLDKRRGDRYNQKADKLLSVWLGLLLPAGDKGAEFTIRPFEGGSESENPTFVLNKRTAFSRRVA
jgi:hypothetical protein